jgi:hypothetical protein
MNYLSDTNLRAILTVLVMRSGGAVLISNEELYEAMMPASGLLERFVVENTTDGVCVSIKDTYQAEPTN